MKLRNLFLLLSVVGFTLSSFACPLLVDDQFEKEIEKEIEAVKLVQEVQRGGYDIVTASELKKWMDAKKELLIIDTMPYEESYKKTHIPGAKQFLFPIPEMKEWNTTETDGKSEEEYRKLLGTETERMIVVYCGFVKCTRSHNGAMWAKKLGYKNVYRYPGGIFAWKGAKYPVEEVK
ncbi:MAG: sulfurtransferase [Desulfobacterium sp.]|nr:sulfurtransferase [Desulfobacterium sp.]